MNGLNGMTQRDIDPMINDLIMVVRTFEEVMEQRIRVSNRISALERYRKCSDCGHEFLPRRFEPCPVCGNEDSILRDDKRTCRNCGHKWEPKMDHCPKCSSPDSVPAPRKSETLEREFGPLQEQEQRLRRDVESVMRNHPVWQEWARGVKGLGEVTLARILAQVDFTRANSATKVWTHCGFGLERHNGEMVPQRKHAGKSVTYIPELRAQGYLMAECLLRAKGGYYGFYVERKAVEAEKPEVKSPMHAHRRAIRVMVKLCLSHIGQVYCETMGLPWAEPYQFAILGHDGSSYIRPEEMAG